VRDSVATACFRTDDRAKTMFLLFWCVDVSTIHNPNDPKSRTYNRASFSMFLANVLPVKASSALQDNRHAVLIFLMLLAQLEATQILC